MKKLVMGAVAALLVTFSATAAQAAIITLDFTSALYASADGFAAFGTTDQGIGVNLAATNGVLQQGSQGIGVDGPSGLDDPGEIGFTEMMVSTLTPNQHVKQVFIEQFFANEIGSADEKADYNVNGGAWTQFTATDAATGLYTINIDQVGVSSIGFKIGTTSWEARTACSPTTPWRPSRSRRSRNRRA